MIALRDEKYFQNIEVAGLGDGGRLLYHYAAPLGKVVKKTTFTTNGLERRQSTEYFISIQGIDRLDPATHTDLRVFSGSAPLDPDRGIKLFINPKVLPSFTFTQTDIENKSLGELFFLLPVLSQETPFAHYARMQELAIREIVLRLTRPLLLMILTLFCFCIGLTQNARYLSTVPKGVYLWVIIIPFALVPIMEVILFLHRMGTVFFYYVLGTVAGTIVIAVLHIFFLILAMLRFGTRIGASMRR
jgi:hypothetical protein